MNTYILWLITAICFLIYYLIKSEIKNIKLEKVIDNLDTWLGNMRIEKQGRKISIEDVRKKLYELTENNKGKGD